eukprot:TRINITY_DN11466_c0_g1_i2.p2 TRINITY_DN11466_c0_g1~~TRINITY_DN11466_c0_g1_i2.p2  ORF type:complete len:296 (-),score=70.41 TRINITY_DN11466_c0_g1_i2:237-1124(-)
MLMFAEACALQNFHDNWRERDYDVQTPLSINIGSTVPFQCTAETAGSADSEARSPTSHWHSQPRRRTPQKSHGPRRPQEACRVVASWVQGMAGADEELKFWFWDRAVEDPWVLGVAPEDKHLLKTMNSAIQDIVQREEHAQKSRMEAYVENSVMVSSAEARLEAAEEGFCMMQGVLRAVRVEHDAASNVLFAVEEGLSPGAQGPSATTTQGMRAQLSQLAERVDIEEEKVKVAQAERDRLARELDQIPDEDQCQLQRAALNKEAASLERVKVALEEILLMSDTSEDGRGPMADSL